MHRTEITAEVVARADRLATFRIGPAMIAKRLGITRYVAGLLVRNASLPPRLGRLRISGYMALNVQPGLEATTVRRIQRMIQVGWLNHTQIAREAGVSLNTVSDVASGKHLAISTDRPCLAKGERFSPQLDRCKECGALLSVMPCRACRARREQN